MNLKDILFNPDDGDNGYFLEVDLLHPPKIKEETKKFPFAPEIINPDNFTPYERKQTKCFYTNKKLSFDWTDKKKYLIFYRMLKFFNRHGMILEKKSWI